MTDKVYIVIGTRGEYSERYEWVAGVYTDKAVAICIATEKLNLVRADTVVLNMWWAKKAELEKKAKDAKLTSVWPLYAATHYNFLRSGVSLTDEEMAAINAQMEEYPGGGDVDDYYIVSAPMDTWGTWDTYEWEGEKNNGEAHESGGEWSPV